MKEKIKEFGKEMIYWNNLLLIFSWLWLLFMFYYFGDYAYHYPRSEIEVIFIFITFIAGITIGELKWKDYWQINIEKK